MKKFNVRFFAFTPFVIAFLCVIAVARPNAASAFSAAGDFSIVNNPNGAWSYGWSTNIGSAFILDTLKTTTSFGQPGLDEWLNGQGDGNASVQYNTTANPIFIGGHTTFQVGVLGINPGTNSAYGIVRWTAPSAGSFTITATFSGISTIGASTDVHIFLDGNSIFNSTVNGVPAPAVFSQIENLVLGDTIDFEVGNENGNNHDDTTDLVATIVPEPTTLALVGMSAGCLFLLRFRKWK